MSTVGVVGMGTMGSGIAQVCLEAGHRVVARDVEQRFIDAGSGRIAAGLAKRVEKQLLSQAEADDARSRLEGACRVFDGPNPPAVEIRAAVHHHAVEATRRPVGPRHFDEPDRQR